MVEAVDQLKKVAYCQRRMEEVRPALERERWLAMARASSDKGPDELLRRPSAAAFKSLLLVQALAMESTGIEKAKTEDRIKA
jgi:hypothetical protein